jgi:hypothetical protein
MSDSNDFNLLDFLQCPISGLIFKNPVKTLDGHTYEHTEICKWLTTKKTSPLTREKLKSTQLTVDNNMKSLVSEYLSKYPQFEKEQYGYIKSFVEAINHVKQIIKQKNYEDFLTLNQFDLSYIINGKPFIHYLSKKIPYFVRNHILENINYSIDNISKLTLHGSPLLHIIVRYYTGTKIKDIVIMLRKRKCKINCINKRTGENIAHIACMMNNPTIDRFIHYLLQCNSELFGQFDLNYRIIPIVNAIKCRNYNIINKIWKVSKNMQFNFDKIYPIHFLAEADPGMAITFILNDPKLLECKNIKGDNPLHCMFDIIPKEKCSVQDNIMGIKNIRIICQEGWKKYLYEKGNLGNTVVKNIIKSYSHEVIKELFDQNIDLKNEIYMIIEMGKTQQMMDLVVDYVIKNYESIKSILFYDNWTIDYYIAIYCKEYQAIKFFTIVGFTNNLTSNNDTICHFIARHNPNILLFAPTNSEIFNVPNNQGIYVIHEIIRYGKYDQFINFMIKNDINCDIATYDGLSIGHYLVKFIKIDKIIQLLNLLPGIYMDFPDKFGKEPVYYAQEIETIKFLLKNYNISSPPKLIEYFITNMKSNELIHYVIEIFGVENIDHDKKFTLCNSINGSYQCKIITIGDYLKLKKYID